MRIIKSEEEEARTVMNFQPKKLSLAISSSAKNFILSQPKEEASSFRIHDLIAQQTGIQELEKASIEERIEQKSLEKIKEIQEMAYREAYNLGLEEGRREGYEEAKNTVQERLTNLDDVLKHFAQVKTDILQRNENQFIDMIYFLASQIAKTEIVKNPERIIPVLRDAVESIQRDESMVIKLSAEDISVIEDLKKISGQNYEFLSKARIEASEQVTLGGCLIETNYGLIDATVEERIKRLGEALAEAKSSVNKDEFK